MLTSRGELVFRPGCYGKRAQKRKMAQKFLSGPFFIMLVRLAGIEPTTPWFVAKYSIQLSYSRDRKEYISFGENGKAASLRHGWNTEHFGVVPVEVVKNTRLRWRNRFLTLTKADRPACLSGIAEPDEKFCSNGKKARATAAAGAETRLTLSLGEDP
jgi:hypothetical protein